VDLGLAEEVTTQPRDRTRAYSLLNSRYLFGNVVPVATFSTIKA